MSETKDSETVEIPRSQLLEWLEEVRELRKLGKKDR